MEKRIAATGQQSLRGLSLLFGLLYVPYIMDHGRRLLNVRATDLPTFFCAAQVVFRERLSAYDYQALCAAGAPIGHRILPPYLYPPPSLLLFYPFSLMGYPLAKTGMLVLNHLLILGFIYLYFGRIARMAQPLWLLCIGLVYVFSYHPIMTTLDHGQVNLLVLLLLCLTWYALRSDAPASLVAMPLSLAILIKTYPALLLVYLLLKGRGRTVLWTLAFLSIATLAAWLLLPPAVWADWYHKVLPFGGYGGVIPDLSSSAHPSNQSLNGLFARLFLENEWTQALWPNARAAAFLAYAAALSVLGATLIPPALAQLRGRRLAETVDLELPVLMLAMFLVAPVSWEHHLVFVLPAALCALQLAFVSQKGRVGQVVVALSCFVIAWDLPLLSPHLRQGVLTLGISIKLYGTAGLWLYLVSTMWRALPEPGRATPPQEGASAYGTA